jgi:hypothetical protein
MPLRNAEYASADLKFSPPFNTYVKVASYHTGLYGRVILALKSVRERLPTSRIGVGDTVSLSLATDKGMTSLSQGVRPVRVCSHPDRHIAFGFKSEHRH